MPTTSWINERPHCRGSAKCQGGRLSGPSRRTGNPFGWTFATTKTIGRTVLLRCVGIRSHRGGLGTGVRKWSVRFLASRLGALRRCRPAMRMLARWPSCVKVLIFTRSETRPRPSSKRSAKYPKISTLHEPVRLRRGTSGAVSVNAARPRDRLHCTDLDDHQCACRVHQHHHDDRRDGRTDPRSHRRATASREAGASYWRIAAGLPSCAYYRHKKRTPPAPHQFWVRHQGCWPSAVSSRRSSCSRRRG
jgi:hypothetical protein